jgi:prophage antirepressor-like protein
MKELVKVFDNHEVRTVIIRGEPWFVAKDVAEVLGYRMASDMTRRIDDDDKGTRLVRTPSGEQQVTIINESGLYASILGSNKAEAKSFKHWVTSEVLPSIRKTGRYEQRKGITAEWERQGVHGMQFATLTMEQSKILFGNRNLKKFEMDRTQVKALMALEAVEQYKLSIINENKLGYYGCKNSMIETATMLEAIKQNAITEATA